MNHITRSLDDALPGRIVGKGAKFLFSLVLVTVAVLGTHPALAESVSTFVYPERVAEIIQEKHDREEILWFARAVYSESQFTSEQRYVAWVVRNRVESPLYPDTYQDVVLQPHQFSGLNPYDRWYELNISRDYGVGDHVWESALAVATEVYSAPSTERLLSADVMHFYSPVAVDTPDWALGHVPVETLHGKKGVRFAFFAGVK